MTAAIEAQIERFAPGFADLIVARSVRTAADEERANPNYVGGDITGGAATLGQTLFRPTVQWNPYRTPLGNVYLCSASTPPGGGVHGMAGHYRPHRAPRPLRRAEALRVRTAGRRRVALRGPTAYSSRSTSAARRCRTPPGGESCFCATCSSMTTAGGSAAGARANPHGWGTSRHPPPLPPFRTGLATAGGGKGQQVRKKSGRAVPRTAPATVQAIYVGPRRSRPECFITTLDTERTATAGRASWRG